MPAAAAARYKDGLDELLLLARLISFVVRQRRTVYVQFITDGKAFATSNHIIIVIIGLY